MNEIYTLKDATDLLGINYMAAWHLQEFSVLNETEILEDLNRGLIFEWLQFIHDHTDSNTNDYEEAVIKLFLNLLGDNMELILLTDELQRMKADSEHAGFMVAVIQDDNYNEIERIPIRLKLDQYILFLEIGSK
jgi:CRISPR/Cas system-associated endonuclease/helicase Cas3